MGSIHKSAKQAVEAGNQFFSTIQDRAHLTMAELVKVLKNSAKPEFCHDEKHQKERLVLAAQLQAIMDDLEHMVEELNEVRDASAQATDAILELAGNAQQIDGVPDAAVDMMGEIVQHCSFQDITGQRLKKIEKFFARIAGQELETSDIRKAEDAKGLLDGPALSGDGLSQSDIDRLLNDM